MACERETPTVDVVSWREGVGAGGRLLGGIGMTASTEPPNGVIVRPKHLKYVVWLGYFTPVLSVDGGPLSELEWSENFVPLPPGKHLLRCYLPYMWFRHMGDSTVEVDIPSTGVVAFQWKVPWMALLRGKWTEVGLV